MDENTKTFLPEKAIFMIKGWLCMIGMGGRSCNQGKNQHITLWKKKVAEVSKYLLPFLNAPYLWEKPDNNLHTTNGS